jgi:hypothetical protein
MINCFKGLQNQEFSFYIMSFQRHILLSLYILEPTIDLLALLFCRNNPVLFFS